MKVFEKRRKASMGTVLVADDDQTCLDSFRKVLERDGYYVESVLNVDDALQALQIRQFDLVVCDYRMPGKTGMDLLQEIRRKSWNLPVLMITADLDAGTEEHARQLGACLMKKPVRRQALLDVIPRLCGALTSLAVAV
jgi:DNA-binding NtrC family response regulator